MTPSADARGAARRRAPMSTPDGLDLDGITLGWERALDADDRALAAVCVHPLDVATGDRRRDLAHERAQIADLLVGVAEMAGIRPTPWLSPMPVARKMLGLPPHVRACLFDLDGVLTDSGVLHALAWAEALDPFLLRLSERTGWAFVPFDRDADYHAFIDGRPRLEG